jgi:hypothetical protein
MYVIANPTKLSIALIADGVDLLNEPVVVHVVVEEVVILSIVLLVVALAGEGHLVVPEEKVERLNS